ncbi:MAG: hypothetical protein JWQ96_3168 [Segetibacter sp.]|nr:hypothetical protein [Segetibacter sp.]
MKVTIKNTLLIAICFILVASCTKKSETFSSATLNDFMPLSTGRSFTYRLDSIVTTRFGKALVVNSYQAKDSIESSFTDNLGRLSYRIFRYIRDTSGMQPWRFAATIYATPTAKNVEYIDNNLRFLKIQLPITEGYSWKAHSFIDTKSSNSPVKFLDEWEYQYQNLNSPYTVFNKTYDSTLTVFQHDETTPPGPFSPVQYQQHNHGVEVYAKGVGLIYKDFLHWTWQTTNDATLGYYENESYGIRLRLISYK